MTLGARNRAISALFGIFGLAAIGAGVYFGITQGNWWVVLLGVFIIGCAYGIYWDGKRKSASNLGQSD